MPYVRQCASNTHIAVVTNDIYTQEDAQFWFAVRHWSAIASCVETGGCPIPPSARCLDQLAAIEQLEQRFADLNLVFLESGGDNLAATFSPELVDLTIYVIDVAAGDKIPRKGGPGITKSDLLVINKTDLAPLVGADPSVMERDTKRM